MPTSETKPKHKRPRSPATPGGNLSRKHNPKHDEPRPCAAPDCRRPEYALGLCQTHHRQLLTTGELRAIRPYRAREAGTVKFAGLRLTPQCAERVKAHAERHGLSRGAVIARILEGWHLRQRKRSGER